jgi:hypothetical protein
VTPNVSAFTRFFVGTVARWSGVLALGYGRLDVARDADRFDRQIRYLKETFDLIAPCDIGYVLRVRRGRHVLLTFDGSETDAYGWVFPILRAHRVRAAFFVAPPMLDGLDPARGTDKQWMTWAMLREMHAAGMTIGGLLGRDGPSAIASYGERIAREIGAGMRAVAGSSGAPRTWDQPMRRSFEEHGVVTAFAPTGGGYRSLDTWDRYAIPRVAVTGESSLSRFRSSLLRPPRA